MELEQLRQRIAPPVGAWPAPAVSTGALDELLEAIEAREVLERSLARLAADRRTPRDVARLAGAVQGMSDAHDDPEAFAGHDLDFHLALASAAKNDVLAARLASLHDHLEEMIALFTDTAFREGTVAPLVEAHRLLCDAVGRRDGDAAPRHLARMMAALRAEARAAVVEIPRPTTAG